jgi:PEP-CTERM motif
LPNVYTEYLQVDATFTLSGQVNPFLQFHGGLTFNPGDNSVTGTSDFASPAASAQKVEILNGTGPVYNLNLQDITIPTLVPSNTPFDAIINMHMSMGDPNFTFDGNNPGGTLPAGVPPDTSTLPTGVGPIGAGGSFAVEFLMTDTSGRFTVQVVPEPSTIALAMIGGVGVFVVLRRRLRS